MKEITKQMLKLLKLTSCDFLKQQKHYPIMIYRSSSKRAVRNFPEVNIQNLQNKRNEVTTIDFFVFL